MGRFVLIVLDSFGVGAMDDCVEVRPRDVGSNTAKHIIQSKPDIKIPTLEKLGLMNAIGEEAGNPTYRAGIIVISSSDVKGQARQNLKAMESAYNVYNDEYSNGLEDNNTKHDIFSGIFLYLWKIAVNFYLTGFFYKYSFFSTNELTSLFHFADSIYNRSPVIEWMQYKVLSAPSN